jgi:hypothetical protein
MARRGEHFPAQAATKWPLADAGAVASRPARLAAFSRRGKRFEVPSFSLAYSAMSLSTSLAKKPATRTRPGNNQRSELGLGKPPFLIFDCRFTIWKAWPQSPMKIQGEEWS